MKTTIDKAELKKQIIYNVKTLYNVEVSDKVIRKTKVYAKRGSLIVNSRNVPYWDVKLGNITAKNID